MCIHDTVNRIIIVGGGGGNCISAEACFSLLWATPGWQVRRGGASPHHPSNDL